jgi:hypothetical protein
MMSKVEILDEVLDMYDDDRDPRMIAQILGLSLHEVYAMIDSVDSTDGDV